MGESSSSNGKTRRRREMSTDSKNPRTIQANGSVVRRLRKKKGWSQDELADEICDRTTIERAENSELLFPRTLKEIAAKLDCTLDEISLLPGDPGSHEYMKLLLRRLGTGLSTHVIEEHVDTIHDYDLVLRQDLLDYSTNDFYSVRRLAGQNASARQSSFLIYSESSERKLTFTQTAVRAFDMASDNELVVESFLPADAMEFTHAFKIYFPEPIAPGEPFDIIYDIRLPGELEVLSPENEIMSISLGRIRRKVKHLDFNVCLNFKPKSVMVEYADAGLRSVPWVGKKPIVREFVPEGLLAARFSIPWMAQPWNIIWGTDNPTSKLYIIHYRN